MDHDFTRRVDRSGGTGSSKWLAMRAKKPDVSPGVIPLSVADMELHNPPEIAEGLKRYLDREVLGYTRASGGYLRAVADWMAGRHGWEARPEWIVHSPGVVPALYHAVRAFTLPGEGVIIQPPVYYPFTGAIRSNGRKVVANPLVLEGGRYTMDFDDLEEKARDPANRLFLLCSPHNPVGRVWTRGELERASEICLRNGVLVVSDEIHFDLLLGGSRHTVYAALSGEAGANCLVCTAPSKTFNLAGMQVSNILIPDRGLRERFQAELARSAVHEPNVLGLKACEIAYTECGPWLDGLLRLLEGNRGMLAGFFAGEMPGVGVFPLEGTYLQWLDFRSFGLGHGELESFMAGEAEWFTDEGYIFGDEGRGFERVNIACPEAVLREALDRLLAAARRRGLGGK